MGDNRWGGGGKCRGDSGIRGRNYRIWTNEFGGYQWAFGVIIFIYMLVG